MSFWVFTGSRPPGVEKTRLAIKACRHGFTVYFAHMDTQMKKIKEYQRVLIQLRPFSSRCAWKGDPD